MAVLSDPTILHSPYFRFRILFREHLLFEHESENRGLRLFKEELKHNIDPQYYIRDADRPLLDSICKAHQIRILWTDGTGWDDFR